MFVLDCESRQSTLACMGEAWEMKTTLLDEFLHSTNLEEQRVGTKRDAICGQKLCQDLESKLRRKAMIPDRVCWFHGTRVSPSATFREGILPLKEMRERVWDTLLDVTRGTKHELPLAELRRKGVTNFSYQNKISFGVAEGPFATLVLDAVGRCEEMHCHDYCKIPEIFYDILFDYQSDYGDLRKLLSRALVPTIIKFWSVNTCERRCIETALYYLYLTSHGMPLNDAVSTCYDGNSVAVPFEQIIAVRRLDADCSVRL